MNFLKRLIGRKEEVAGIDIGSMLAAWARRFVS